MKRLPICDHCGRNDCANPLHGNARESRNVAAMWRAVVLPYIAVGLTIYILLYWAERT